MNLSLAPESEKFTLTTLRKWLYKDSLRDKLPLANLFLNYRQLKNNGWSLDSLKGLTQYLGRLAKAPETDIRRLLTFPQY